MPRTRASAPVLSPNPPSSRGNACSRAAAEASAARATGASRSSSASRRHAGPRGGAGARSRAIEAAARGRKRAGLGRQRRWGGEKKKHQSSIMMRAARGGSARHDARVGLAKKAVATRVSRTGRNRAEAATRRETRGG
jgi:hypothetical protein